MAEPFDNVLNQLEEEGEVPAYLKGALTSEIDFIRDILQVVSLFGGVFFDTARKALVTLTPDDQEENEADSM